MPVTQKQVTRGLPAGWAEPPVDGGGAAGGVGGAAGWAVGARVQDAGQAVPAPLIHYPPHGQATGEGGQSFRHVCASTTEHIIKDTLNVS